MLTSRPHQASYIRTSKLSSPFRENSSSTTLILISAFLAKPILPIPAPLGHTATPQRRYGHPPSSKQSRKHLRELSFFKPLSVRVIILQYIFMTSPLGGMYIRRFA